MGDKMQHLSGRNAHVELPLSQGAFVPGAIAAETAEINAAIRARLKGGPKLWDVAPADHRAAAEAGTGLFGPVTRSELASQHVIAGPGGDLRLHVLTPPQVEGVYLYFHGGGWVVGAAHLQDAMLENVARRTNMAVVSVEYRLAPEHPYPAALDDAEAAALWLVEQAAEQFGTDRLTVGGESAGAHLSVCTLLRLRDRHGCHAFRGANLVFGMFDLGLTPSARQSPEAILTSTADIQWFVDQFVPEGLRREPDVSPLYSELHNLPPALFTVGTQDALLDDSLFMYARWLAAGNAATLALYPGGAHGFNSFPCGITNAAHARSIAFLNDALADDAALNRHAAS
jgi:acetyl esterase